MTHIFKSICFISAALTIVIVPKYSCMREDLKNAYFIDLHLIAYGDFSLFSIFIAAFDQKSL